jgi:ParB-like chromosome segregation protein Spo0J
MSTPKTASDFAPIQQHIARFRLERMAAIAQDLADAARAATLAIGRAWKRLGAAMERGYCAELDRRAVEADAFLRRSAPRY